MERHSDSAMSTPKNSSKAFGKYSTMDKFNTSDSAYKQTDIDKKSSHIIQTITQINQDLTKQNRNLKMKLWKFP